MAFRRRLPRATTRAPAIGSPLARSRTRPATRPPSDIRISTSATPGCSGTATSTSSDGVRPGEEATSTTGPGGRPAISKRPDASRTVADRIGIFHPRPPRSTTRRKDVTGLPEPGCAHHAGDAPAVGQLDGDLLAGPAHHRPRLREALAGGAEQVAPGLQVAERESPVRIGGRLGRDRLVDPGGASALQEARAHQRALDRRPAARHAAGDGGTRRRLPGLPEPDHHAMGRARRAVDRGPSRGELRVTGLQDVSLGCGQGERASRAARRPVRGRQERPVAGRAPEDPHLRPLDRLAVRTLDLALEAILRAQPHRDPAHALPGAGVEGHLAESPLGREGDVAGSRGGRELPAAGLGRLEPERAVGGGPDRGRGPGAGEGDLRAGDGAARPGGADHALERAPGRGQGSERRSGCGLGRGGEGSGRGGARRGAGGCRRRRRRAGRPGPDPHAQGAEERDGEHGGEGPAAVHGPDRSLHPAAGEGRTR